MNAEQTKELIEYIDPEEGKEVAKKMLPILFTDAPLGVACHLSTCAASGE